MSWQENTAYGAKLDAQLYNDDYVKTLLTELNLTAMVDQLAASDQLAPTTQQAANYRNIAMDFWRVTSAGVLEDGNTSTLGAVKPQSIARLVETLQSFVVASDEQAKMSRHRAERLIVTHKVHEEHGP